MEGDIDRGHITVGVKKVHMVALMHPRVANKHAFESMKDEFREGKRVILDKSSTSKDSRKKREERRGG